MIGFLVAVVAVVAAAAYCIVAGRGISSLVHAAPPAAVPGETRGSLRLVDPSEAFDGQYYYRLAIAPWSGAERVEGIGFDIPALRAQRIGYPLVVFVASAGDPDLVPAALLAVNVVAYGALGAVSAVLARRSGRHAAWGLLVAGHPGFVYALLFDLAEIVAAALLVSALLALRAGRAVIASVLLVAAVLTRETMIVVPVALVLSALWPARSRPSRVPNAAGLLVAATPALVVAGAYQLVLRARWGELPLDASREKNVRWPFAGFVDQLDRFVPPTTGAALFRGLSLALVVAMVAVALARWPRSAPRHERIALAVALCVVPLLSGYIWAGATSFMRALTEVTVLAALLVLSAPAVPRDRGGRWLLLATLGTGAASVASEVAATR